MGQLLTAGRTILAVFAIAALGAAVTTVSAVWAFWGRGSSERSVVTERQR